MSDDAEAQVDETSEDAGEAADQEDSSVLSDAEVGALLDGVADGVVETGGGLGRRGEVREYTFADNAHVSSYCPAALVTLYERLCRRMRDDLQAITRTDVEIDLDALRRYRYDDYVASVNEPVSITVIRENTLPGAGLMAFDAPLIGGLVDRYYGGAEASAAERDGRDLTPVELRMAQTCAEGFLEHMNAIWSAITPVKFAAIVSDTVPKLMTVAGPSDRVLVARMTVRMGEAAGEHHLVLPLAMIAPMRAALAANGQGQLAARARFVGQVREHLRDVPVDMVGTLCEFELSLRELVAMAPGDIVPIDIPPHAVLRIDGANVLHGRFGRSRGINAIAVAYREPVNDVREEQR